MGALLVIAPHESQVREVDAPVAVQGQVIVDVERVRVCVEPLEFFTGEMAYLKEGFAHHPMRLGHEWRDGHIRR